MDEKTDKKTIWEREPALKQLLAFLLGVGVSSMLVIALYGLLTETFWVG